MEMVLVEQQVLYLVLEHKVQVMVEVVVVPLLLYLQRLEVMVIGK
jgi:hypothetical protein